MKQPVRYTVQYDGKNLEQIGKVTTSINLLLHLSYWYIH